MGYDNSDDNMVSHLVSCDKLNVCVTTFSFQCAIFCSVTIERSHQFHPHSILCIIV